MITMSEAVSNMIKRCSGDQYDICHFLKVWAYARTLGELEGLDARTQQTLELAAIVHDIACPDLRKKHGGHAPGNLQEKFGPPAAKEFYKDAGLDGDMLERICYLVSRHHTFTGVDGMDYQILLEADFLVNAGEDEGYNKSVEQFRKNVFKTESGKALLDSMFPLS